DAARIKLKLKKLNVLASVLYVAAHPDDENTQIITQMSNGKLAAAAYLSMTRGDGGQNLIGPEIRDELGLIRTQELLSARRIDGGTQFFTRANDFGFSKSADETFKIWDKAAILSDVVKVFREFQPDVIITRFPPDQRAGHGHHTASAILAQEAFDAAASANAFPDQLTASKVWQIKRLYMNTGAWWNKTVSEKTPGIITINVGAYSPLLGASYTEIAALSSSQHKSQGYGSEGIRGNELEFLEYVKGEKATTDIFEGVNTTWSRIENSAKVQQLVSKAIQEFDAERPAAMVAVLLQIRKEITALEPGVWKNRKLIEVDQLIQDCVGLFVGITADRYWATPSEEITVNAELVNRSGTDVIVESIKGNNVDIDSTLSTPLMNNISLQFHTKHRVTATAYSDPYWLQKPHSVGKFTVDNPSMIGKGENDPAITITFTFKVQGEPLHITKAVQYKWADPVKGELTRPFAIVPPVFVNLGEKVMVFPDGHPREVNVKIKSSMAGSVQGTVRLTLPTGWRATPAEVPFSMQVDKQEEVRKFTVYPSSNESTAILSAEATVNGKIYNQSLRTIAYDHIPTQVLLPPATAKMVRIDLKKDGSLIGYVKGAGDEVPAALRSMGFEVWEMKNEEVTATNLKRLDAIVLGVRTLNVNDRFPYMVDDLLAYVKAGGTMVVQYNTNGEFEDLKFAPYPLTISRTRVTQENAEVRFLHPDNILLNKPNKISQHDFEGWVQERGLYYPSKWDPAYEPLFSMNDDGEAPLDGSLLIARYGLGRYIYTGISFFRQLPEGVPGAYKLFANLVSSGKEKEKKDETPKPKAGTKAGTK
ncbi:MAG TPA: PIG-L family deacetylase, partial [Chryseolinea sp.]|nr:PIG-L family deacetylase [Chryseolinea sp.]